MREPDGPGTNKLSKIEGERVDLDVPFRILRSKTPRQSRPQRETKDKKYMLYCTDSLMFPSQKFSFRRTADGHQS